MSKKDYIQFAQMIKGLVNEAKAPTTNAAKESEQLLYCSIFAHKTADIFAADNQNFDYHRFFTACGLED